MKKTVVACILCFLLSSVILTLFTGALALADGIAVRRDYTADKPGLTILDSNGLVWDLTRGPLTLSFSLDMSGYQTKENWTFSEIGLYGPGDPFARHAGWMAFGSPGGTRQDTTIFDQNDKLVLRGSLPRFPDDEFSYNSVNPMTYDTDPIAPSGWGSNIWFDRGAATNEQNPPQANTNGRYDVTITYTAINKNYGTMFATVNGRPNIYRMNVTGAPVTAGKYFYTDMSQVRVFSDLETPGVTVSNLNALGAPSKPTVVGLNPNEAPQGKVINGLGINGFQFRDTDASMKLQYGSTTETITGTNVRMNTSPEIRPAGTQMLADIKIPENATPGAWDACFSHDDDPTGVGMLEKAFNVKATPPEVTGITPDHARPGTSFNMTISGAHFRNTPTTIELYKFGVEPVVATNVNVVSSSKITACFKIPTGTFIDANWTMALGSADGQAMCGFSVDARMDIINPFGIFNIIWLRAPGLIKVVLYSEGSFDATAIFPLAVELGGTFPIACNPQDVNRDGKKDQVFYFNNMAVNLPTGCNSVRMLGADWTLKRIKAWDTVRVFRFLF